MSEEVAIESAKIPEEIRDDPWLGANPFDPDFKIRPWPALKRLREIAPVHLNPLGNWRLSRYADCLHLLRDVKCGVRHLDGRTTNQARGVDTGPGSFMLQQDPPNHTRLRKVVGKAFTPRMTESIRSHVENIVEALLDRAADEREMEIISDLALVVPSTVICEMMGVPLEDRDHFTVWTADATHLLAASSLAPEVLERCAASAMKLSEYCSALIEERRKNLGDDLVSTLIRAHDDGSRLSPEELLSQTVGLLIAGFETTIGLIGNGVYQLLWVDRTGAVTEVIGNPQQGLRWPFVSPDNAKAAVLATEAGAQQIWIHELARGTRRPFPDKGAAEVAGWVSGDRLAYRSERKTYVRSVTRSDPPELLVDDRTMTISPDRRYAATERRVGATLDIYYFDLQAGGGALPLLVSDATEAKPAIRPDGGWLAYLSNETGRNEVYIVRFPSGEGKRQVSVDGGMTPHWSGQGGELFFQTDQTNDADIMFVAVTTEPELQLTEPKRLFGGADANISIQRGWSVSSDGQRILGVRAVTSESDTRRITVVENWYREFEKR